MDRDKLDLQVITELQRIGRDSLFKRFMALDSWGKEGIMALLILNEERIKAERRGKLSVVNGGRS